MWTGGGLPQSEKNKRKRGLQDKGWGHLAGSEKGIDGEREGGGGRERERDTQREVGKREREG